MIKASIVSLLIALFITGVAFSQGGDWELVKSNNLQYLHGVDFVDANTGWAVGDFGTILKTTSGGVYWVSQSIDSIYSLASVDFVDEVTGWAVGYDTGGVILKTTDGGSSWTQQYSGKFLNSVQFVSPTIGWSVGPDGVILKTTEGGSTWSRQIVPDTTVFFTSLFFVDSTMGWVGGQIPGTILKTTDGGTTWETQTSGIDPGEAINAVFFIDQQKGWLTGYNKPDTIGIGVIKKTTDGGVSWVSQTSGTDQYLLSSAFVDANVGWVTGGGGVIRKTTDGGNTWISDTSGTIEELGKLVVRSDEGGWIVGSNGTILRNNFGGLKKLIKSTIVVNDQWNILSVPVAVFDNRKFVLFQSAMSNAYRYAGQLGYLADDSLEMGTGYWLKFDGQQSISISGFPIDSFTVELIAGWNLVGGITNDVPVGNIIQSPPNSIQAIFQYDNGYQTASLIEHGKGYWFKCSQNCQITFQSTLQSDISKELLTDITKLRTDEIPPPPPDGTISQQSNLLLPTEYALHQSYPNPFNPTTTIQYELPKAAYATLKIYNVLGQEVAVLVDGMQEAGYKSVTWNAKNLPSSVYFSRLTAGTYTAARKLLLTK